MKVRAEVAIYSLVVSVALLSWSFFPIWYLASVNYSQYLTPLGFEIAFFGRRFELVCPLTLSAVAFFVVSAVIPLVWRSSRYSLYSSTLASTLGLAMVVNSLIFQQRYLTFHGYSVLPTPTGAFYIFFPSHESFSFPFYLVLASVGISLLNSATRASWLPTGRLTLLERLVNDLYERGVINALASFFDRLGVKYALTEGGALKVGGVLIGQGEGLDPFFPTAEIVLFGERYVAFIDKEGEVRYLDLNDGIRFALAKSLEGAEIAEAVRNTMYGD